MDNLEPESPIPSVETDPKSIVDSSTELIQLCQREYRGAEIEYYDYATQYQTHKRDTAYTTPTITQGQTEPYLNPMGRYGGQYRASQLCRAYLERIPDPSDRNNCFLIYPSIDNTSQLNTLMILKYPEEIFKSILVNHEITKYMSEYPTNPEAMKIIKNVRTKFVQKV